MNKESNKNILVLSYYFPPAGGPGVQRILKFVKYLPEFGWKPIVLTVKNGDFPAVDESLIDEIPDNTPIYKAPAIEPYSLYRIFTGKDKDANIPVGVLAKNDDLTIFEKIANWIRANIFIPDARIGWILSVIYKVRTILRKYNIQALLSSSPPHSLQLSSKWISKKYNLPWICDLRDPWTNIYYYQNLNRSRLSHKLDRKMEREVLKSADAVTTVSPDMINNFNQKVENNYIFIPNGYDVADMEQAGIDSESNEFSIAYIGNFKSNQNIQTVWQVIKDIIEVNKIFKKNIKLKLTGNIHPDILSTLNKLDLDNILDLEGYVPHNTAIKRMKEATVLLFIIPKAKDNKGILTGKLFEYLASDTPLLSIGPPHGDAAQIIKEVDGGEIFDYNDKEGISNRLETLFKEWKNGDLNSFSPDKSKVEKYDRKRLTQKLANQLNNF